MALKKITWLKFFLFDEMKLDLAFVKEDVCSGSVLQ